MKIKLSKAFLYFHLVFSFLVQISCGEIIAFAINDSEFYISILSIAVINLIQFIFVRSNFHGYRLNHKYPKLFILECVCAIMFIAYNLLMNRFVYEQGLNIYFADIIFSIIIAIPFIISMSKIEE